MAPPAPEDPADLIWAPGEEGKAASKSSRFIRLVTERTDTDCPDYATLHTQPANNRAAFWPLTQELREIPAGPSWDRVLKNPSAMPGAGWFVGSQLNFAGNLLRCRDKHQALVSHCENGERSHTCCRELAVRVVVAGFHITNREKLADPAAPHVIAEAPGLRAC